MKKLLLLAVIFTPSSAFAQSSGMVWKNGAVLTAQQLQQLDNAKINTSRIGIPNGVAPLDANKMMSAPVSGDVSGATINSQTVAEVAAKANNAVQKTDANLANGYAKLDGSGHVTVPVTGSVADAPANATGDTVSSIAAKANNAIPITGGTSTNQTINDPSISSGTAVGLVLTGAQVPQMPEDIPGHAGTGLPNTFWVDKYYAPKGWFIASNTTWTVCASGCNYTTPLDAWNAALSANFLNGAILTISISDGTYDITNQFYTETSKTQNVHVVGDTADPSKVILNFTNTKGTNFGGFSAYKGAKIGFIDGMTIQAPTDGTGSLASTDSSGRHIWNSQSYGAGIQAYGAGSNISVGSHVVIRNFYYSMVADNNGGIYAPSGGVTMSVAGDVNAMARGGGVIVCTPCSATDASDYTDPTNTLGSNYDAERGGSLYIDGSTGSKSLVNGIVGLTGGHIWAHNTVFSGSLISGQGSGAWITGNSSVEFTGSKFSGYNNGILAQSGGVAFVDSCNITDNTYGIVADNGRINGNSVTITNNTTYGIQALHQGTVVLFNTYAKMSGNGTNFAVQSAGTEATSGTAYTASSIDVQ